MDRLRRQLAALAAFITLSCVLAPHAEAQTTRTRAIILSFEGWNAEAARAAIESGLNAAYDMISEQQAVDTAMQIGVDPSTPEGLGAVVARLHIQLVIGGSVSGRGARATTTIWVTDTSGNQLATRTAGAPSGRGFEGELTTAALQACGEAVAQLPPPPTSGGRTSTGPGPGPGPGPSADPESGGTVEPEPTPEPDYDPDYDIENEVAGRPRGQGHGSSGRRDEHHDDGHAPGRWNQPYFRANIGVDIRNMSASTSGGTGGPPTSVDNLPVPFSPLIGLWLEARPFAGNDDALRGLYGYLNTEFSVGQTYYRVDDMSPDTQQRDLYLYGLDFGVGYAGTIAEVFELIGTVGAGVDGLGLADAVSDGSSWGGSTHAHCNDAPPTAPPTAPGACQGSRDFPSIQAWYIRPEIQARIRLADDLLILEGAFAGRIIVSWGDLANADFGSPGGGGIDWSLGLAGIIDPGFTWRARFGYSGNYVTFSDPGVGLAGDANNGWSRDSGTIEAWRITLGIGWAFR